MFIAGALRAGAWGPVRGGDGILDERTLASELQTRDERICCISLSRLVCNQGEASPTRLGWHVKLDERTLASELQTRDERICSFSLSRLVCNQGEASPTRSGWHLEVLSRMPTNYQFRIVLSRFPKGDNSTKATSCQVSYSSSTKSAHGYDAPKYVFRYAVTAATNAKGVNCSAR